MTFELLQSKAVRFGAAILVAGSLAFAGVAPAFAAQTETGEASTGVYIQADDSKLVASVPTEIHVQVNGDGTFICPEASATQVSNGSIFDIHVDNIKTTLAEGFTFEADGDNAITFNLNAVSAADAAGADGLAITDTAWDMTKTGTDGATIDVETSGSIANVTKDLSTDQQFMTVDWTFAAGSAA